MQVFIRHYTGQLKYINVKTFGYLSEHSALYLKKVYMLISNLVFIYLWGKSALIAAKQQK